MEGIKVCARCRESKPANNEFFGINNASKDGLNSYCKSCRKEISKSERTKHKQRIMLYDKKYKQKNKEHISKTNKLYRESHKEHISFLKSEWGKRNLDRVNIRSHRYRAKKQNLDSHFNNKQWNDCLKYFDFKCAYCGSDDKLSQEHFVPVSKDGEYTQNNIIPACLRCNSSKCDNDFFTWYPKQLFYNKKREKAILDFLGYLNTQIQQISMF